MGGGPLAARHALPRQPPIENDQEVFDFQVPAFASPQIVPASTVVHQDLQFDNFYAIEPNL